MKRKVLSTISFFVCIAIISAFCVYANAESSASVYGDLNHDGIITSDDALQALRWSVGLDEYTEAQKQLADVDSDGDITAADALDILRYSVRLDVSGKVGQPAEAEQTPDIPSSDTDTQTDTDTSGQKKALVAYFSRTGNTEKIARYISELTGADIYAIEAAVPYSDEDIEYTADCRANREQNDRTVRPEIKTPIGSIDDYDVIYLGYAIWWGEEPRIIDTFLESCDFSDKTVIPFCTSASSGISTSEKNIAELVPIGSQPAGRRFSAGASKEDVSAWLNTLTIAK